MVGYKIIIGSTGYKYVLVEPQNNNQFYGESVSFSSEDECRKNLASFIGFLSENKNRTYDRWLEFIQIEKGDEGIIYRFYMNNHLAFYRVKPFNGPNAMTNCKKSINSIFKYSEDFLQREK